MSRHGNGRDNAVAESFFSSLKKDGSENAYIKPGIWPGPISSITLKCPTTGSGATVNSAASVRRPSNRPLRDMGSFHQLLRSVWIIRGGSLRILNSTYSAVINYSLCRPPPPLPGSPPQRERILSRK